MLKKTSMRPIAFTTHRFEGSAWRPAQSWLRRGWVIAGIAVVLLVLLILLLKEGGSAAPVTDASPPTRHPLAVAHVPPFITPPGATDVLLIVMAVVLLCAVLAAGVFFFWLHSLPERLVHKSTKVHFDIVAVLALLSLFTHIHIFWVAALLLALVKIPDFSLDLFPGLLRRMTVSLERIADAQPKATDGAPSQRNEER